jgi:hypothetical protein
MTLPGSNYNLKPYVDDGALLPEIGARVAYIDGLHFEGTVVAVRSIERHVVVKWDHAQESTTVSARQIEPLL